MARELMSNSSRTAPREDGPRMIHAPKVLIIDDSITARAYMKRVLHNEGYEALTASDGREGLKMVHLERPECVILDVVLPGMSGFEVCRRLRAQEMLRNLPVIMVSTKNTPVDQSWAIRQGATSYLVKPFSEEALVHAVKTVLPAHISPVVAPRQTPVNQPGPANIVREARVAANPLPIEQKSPISPTYGSLRSTRPSIPNEPRRATGQQEVQRSIPNEPRRTAEQQEVQLQLHKMIPHRNGGADLLRVNDPLSVNITDRQARLLYSTIDGRKDVGALCVATHMTMEDVIRALRILLSLHRIQLREPGGRAVNSTQFFVDS